MGSLLLVGGECEGLVRGFGNEGVVLNEGAGDYSFRLVDSELDECKRDPLVALLDDASLAENDFLRYEVMREAVSFTCHKHLQFVVSRFVNLAGKRSSSDR